MSDIFGFSEKYLTPDGREYIDAARVREALGIMGDEDIFLAIKKLREKLNAKQADIELTDRLYKENRDFVDKVCEAVDIQRPYSKSGYDNAVKSIAEIKRERDQLKEKCDKLKARDNAMYGASCGYSGDEAPAFRCNVISYSWEFGSMFGIDSIRVELELTPAANYKGTIDMEDLKRYIQEYGREKKLGVLESVDYQNAKAARAELAYLYKQVLGKERLDRDLSPHEVMKAILDACDKREDFIRELSCSLGFGYPVVNPDNIDQKEKDILERVEKLKSGVWPCENTSTFAEYLRKEFPKFCERYNVVPLTNASIHDWIQYIFEVLDEWRGKHDTEWNRVVSLQEFRDSVCDALGTTTAVSDSYLFKNIEKLKLDHKEIQEKYSRYCLAVGSLLDIPEEARDDINAIERSFDSTEKAYESLKKFRDNVCEIFDIPSSMADDQEQMTNSFLLKRVADIYKDWGELNDLIPKLRGDIRDWQVKYNDMRSKFEFQSGLRQQWHERYESEHERANGVQKCLDKTREALRAKDISLETAKKQYEKVCGNLETAECALNGMKSKVHELQDEKTKVISALGQDIWDDCLT